MDWASWAIHRWCGPLLSMGSRCAANLFYLGVCGSHFFAGQFAGLLHPGDDLSFVELVGFVNVEVAHFFLLRFAGRHGTQRCAAEENHFDVLREAMKAEEPALALDAIEGRVPFDCLVHAGNDAGDERVEATSDITLPAGHGRDVGLDGCVAVGLRDLRVAAGEELWAAATDL